MVCHLAAAGAHPPGQLAAVSPSSGRYACCWAMMAHLPFVHSLHWLNRKMAVLLLILHQAKSEVTTSPFLPWQAAWAFSNTCTSSLPSPQVGRVGVTLLYGTLSNQWLVPAAGAWSDSPCLGQRWGVPPD